MQNQNQYTMKTKILLFSAIALLSSCISVKEIGSLNMISTRNVSPELKYKPVATYVNSDKKELKRSRSKTIEDAINEVIKKTPGGEFLMNVKIYQITNKNNGKKSFAVSGDVWGMETAIFGAFKVGDRVVYKKIKNAKQGKVIALKDNNTCFIQIDGEDKAFEVPYSDLTKAE